MSKNTSRVAWVCAAVCGALAIQAQAASPSFKVLYHESIDIQSHPVGAHPQRLHLQAYGKDFSLLLEPNEGIRRAVPAGRQDIEPLKGVVEGQAGSWARMTRTRAGWRGMLFDGQELYAIEPAADIADAVVQPLVTQSGTSPVMYRLADTRILAGPAFCATVTPDNVVSSDPAVESAPDPRPTAKTLFNAIAQDLSNDAQFPTKRLTTGVVADYEFYQQFIGDPEGAIIARMDIVDGIFSTQIGVKISLAPLTVIQAAHEPFTKTAASDLLSQLRQYRKGSATQMSLGVTHLMTGRDLDGDTVGIAYQGTVCSGETSASLSEGGHSTTMSALIAAHELGHNFNAPHDGVPGACASTPQTFLMAPQINMSNQFSSCSIQQIEAKIQTAQCLTPYFAPDVNLTIPSNLIGAQINTLFTLSFAVAATGDDPSNTVVASATLPPGITVQSATVAEGNCTWGAGTVSCQLGNLAPADIRNITLQATASVAGQSNVTVTVSAANDSDTANDSGSFIANISDAATSPVTQPSGGSGSSGAGPGGAGSGGDSGAGSTGGGGGRIDLSFVALLSLSLVLTSMRDAKRRSIRRTNSRSSAPTGG